MIQFYWIIYLQNMGANWHSIFEVSLFATSGYFSRLLGDVICHAFLYTRQEIVENFLYTFCFCYYFYWTYQVLHCWRIIYCLVWNDAALMRICFLSQVFFYFLEWKTDPQSRSDPVRMLRSGMLFDSVGGVYNGNKNQFILFITLYSCNQQWVENEHLLRAFVHSFMRKELALFTTISNFHCLLHTMHTSR